MVATFIVFPSVQEPLKVGDADRAAAVYCLDDLRSKPTFDAAAFHDQLQTKEFGGVLISAAALPSTQSLLQDNSRQLPHGTLCIADVQKSGRGRCLIHPANRLYIVLDVAKLCCGDCLRIVYISWAMLSDNQRTCATGGCHIYLRAAQVHPCAGRGGNTWTSPPGCLMFSLLTRLDIEGANASLHFMPLICG